MILTRSWWQFDAIRRIGVIDQSEVEVLHSRHTEDQEEPQDIIFCKEGRRRRGKRKGGGGGRRGGVGGLGGGRGGRSVKEEEEEEEEALRVPESCALVAMETMFLPYCTLTESLISTGTSVTRIGCTLASSANILNISTYYYPNQRKRIEKTGITSVTSLPSPFFYSLPLLSFPPSSPFTSFSISSAAPSSLVLLIFLLSISHHVPESLRGSS